ncbi:MAG: type I methionyl aminopeptidase [Candidatus Berkelbacteria bacterium]|nr:type I methionyl aminopeptidase [Candidatus Berkelbacteria bacterium]
MINIYSSSEIQILKEGGKILAKVFDELIRGTKPGTNEMDINKKAIALIRSYGAVPSFLGYRGYPAAICISINHELVHGIPKDRITKNGDIVSLDLGLKFKKLCLDKAFTFCLGRVNKKNLDFLSIINRSLENGIKQAEIGKRIGHISSAIQKTIENKGYSVVVDLFGHGVGWNVHEDPKIPNFGSEHDGPFLKEGMVLAIEPMALMGHRNIKVAKDGYTIESADGSLAAHFEETVAITKNGPIILTR